MLRGLMLGEHSNYVNHVSGMECMLCIAKHIASRIKWPYFTSSTCGSDGLVRIGISRGRSPLHHDPRNQIFDSWSATPGRNFKGSSRRRP